MSEQAMTLRAPWASTRASWVARASNCVLVNQMNRNVHSKYLVRGSHELQAGDFRHFCGDFDVESFLCVQTLTLSVRKCANEGCGQHPRFQQRFHPAQDSLGEGVHP
jgi:hypothetical protein